MEKIVVSRKKFDKVADIVKREKLEEVSFEFVVGSLFPKALENIKKEISFQHAKGYIEGLRAAEENVEGAPVDNVCTTETSMSEQ